MRQQFAKVHFPEIKITVDGKELDVGLPPLATNTVNGIRDLRTHIKEELANLDPRRIKEELIEALDNTNLHIELSDCEVDCPIHYVDKSHWNWEIGVSESTVQMATGNMVIIGYGSTCHNSLHKIRYKDNYSPTPKTFTTLEQLGLITMRGRLTNIGFNLLDQLAEEDISIQTKRRMQFSKALLTRTSAITPAQQFAIDSNFVQFTTKHNSIRQHWYIFDYSYDDPENYPNSWYPTVKGYEWLVKHATHILNHPECTKRKREQMIPYSPLENLVEYLTHEDSRLRKPALATFEHVIGDKLP